jgi:hypothetical protein
MKVILFLALLASMLDAVNFPIIGYILGSILVCEIKYTIDPSFYEMKVQKLTLVLAGVAIWAGIIAGIRQILFAVVSDHSIRQLRR